MEYSCMQQFSIKGILMVVNINTGTIKGCQKKVNSLLI